MVEKEKLAAVGGCDEFEIFGAMMPGSPVPRIPLTMVFGEMVRCSNGAHL